MRAAGARKSLPISDWPPDGARKPKLLEAVASSTDAGRLKTTIGVEPSPSNGATMRDAPARDERSSSTGNVVVTGFDVRSWL
jgi:hypothetical protein